MGNAAEKQRCHIVLDNGKRCSRKVVRGSRFCWSHELKKNLNWLSIVGIILAVAIFIASLVITAHYSSKSEESALSIANKQQERKLPRFDALPATIVSGGATYYIDVGQTARLSNFDPFTYGVTEDGSLLVNGIIRDKNGKIIVAVKDSQLFMSLGVNYDINSDESSLEIVNDSQEPVFQVMVDKTSLIFNFVAYVPSSTTNNGLNHVIAMGNKMAVNPSGDLAELDSLSLPCIFLYPGYEFPGVRNTEQN